MHTTRLHSCETVSQAAQVEGDIGRYLVYLPDCVHVHTLYGSVGSFV